jgi:hypothetical protein
MLRAADQAAAEQHRKRVGHFEFVKWGERDLRRVAHDATSGL